MKKTILMLSALSFLAIASTAFAQGFVPLAPIPGLTDPGTATSVVNSSNFANFFNNLYKYCIGLSAALAVIMIIWGGLEYATQDIPGAKNAGKEKIQNAILGLVLVLSPVLVFSIINPKKLELAVAPKMSERFAVAVVFCPADATSEREALPCPLPVGRSVIELPVCAAEPLRNHWRSGAPFVVGIENGAA